MKITAKQFALSLYESVDGKSAAQVKPVIEKFVLLLAGKNQLVKAEKIIAEFVKIWNLKRGVVEAGVTSARELDRETVKFLKSYLMTFSGAKEVKLSQEVDEKLLGGVVIRYGDKILDGSLKTALVDLKEKLIK
jgi:F-type H+-transporting ATPase subunit delta